MANFSIRNKIFISYFLLALIALMSSFYLIYASAEKNLQKTFTSELKNSTELINNLVYTVARSSIENHLRSIAETQLRLVEGLYQDYQDGRFSEEQAKDLATRFLLRQGVGTTGYTYCLNSDGWVVFHPDKLVEESDVSSFAFVQQQMYQKSGYLEYSWRNTSDESPRDKALYMSYFPAWDWIISVSAYKSEFDYLIDIPGISAALSKITFGETGYSFILGADGTYIYHPLVGGKNFKDLDLPDEFTSATKEILRQREGVIYYELRNPGERVTRRKVAIVTAVEDFGWIVGTSAYLDELYSPLNQVKKVFWAVLVAFLLINLLASYALSSLISRPLRQLMNHLRNQVPGDIKPIEGPIPDDEIGGVARYLNQFIGKLNEHNEALISEISVRKASEKALRTSEQTFHTLFNNSFQFIALLDPQGRICKINQVALDFRHLTIADVEGEYFWETPWWAHSTTLVGQLRDAVATALSGKTSRFEAFSDAVREIYLDISVKPVVDDAGEVIYLIAEARDVTEVRRAEKELQQAQKMESVGMLAGGIAHDFNNALSGILGTIDLLKIKQSSGMAVDCESFFTHLDRISGAALRARDVVNKLLTLSKKIDFKFVSADLSEILTEVSVIARNSFDKSIAIEEQLAEKAFVRGDINSLEQVFLNLYINSAHAMTLMRPEGECWGGDLKVACSKVHRTADDDHAEGEFWCVTISDTGVGIAASDLTKVFDPFFTTKAKGVGSGLGLAMVYNIVRQHDGFVEIDSRPGQGTVIRVCLPLSAQRQLEQGEDAVPVSESGQETILVIDDEELLRINAQEFLEVCGYKVLLAADGTEGIEVYRQQQHEIDAVLLDLVMPVMSGREAFFALREINPRVKVLLSSGFRLDARVEEIMAAGANDFIQKPYSLYSLSQGIRKILHEE